MGDAGTFSADKSRAIVVVYGCCGSPDQNIDPENSASKYKND
jgi:hypothetical protein